MHKKNRLGNLFPNGSSVKFLCSSAGIPSAYIASLPGIFP